MFQKAQNFSLCIAIKYLKLLLPYLGNVWPSMLQATAALSSLKLLQFEHKIFLKQNQRRYFEIFFFPMCQSFFRKLKVYGESLNQCKKQPDCFSSSAYYLVDWRPCFSSWRDIRIWTNCPNTGLIISRK